VQETNSYSTKKKDNKGPSKGLKLGKKKQEGEDY
jgi:hypothetical protein